MSNKKLGLSFAVTLVLALLLRFFVVDVISVSNDSLEPELYPGDFLLISKISQPTEGQWAMLKNYPQKSMYSIRRLASKTSQQGWKVVETKLNETEAKPIVENKQIMGRAVMILWSLPCKPAVVVAGKCPDKTARYFKKLD